MNSKHGCSNGLDPCRLLGCRMIKVGFPRIGLDCLPTWCERRLVWGRRGRGEDLPNLVRHVRREARAAHL